MSVGYIEHTHNYSFFELLYIKIDRYSSELTEILNNLDLRILPATNKKKIM